jgi:hypothetical protein
MIGILLVLVIIGLIAACAVYKARHPRAWLTYTHPGPLRCLCGSSTFCSPHFDNPQRVEITCYVCWGTFWLACDSRMKWHSRLAITGHMLVDSEKAKEAS